MAPAKLFYRDSAADILEHAVEGSDSRVGAQELDSGTSAHSFRKMGLGPTNLWSHKSLHVVESSWHEERFSSASVSVSDEDLVPSDSSEFHSRALESKAGLPGKTNLLAQARSGLTHDLAQLRSSTQDKKSCDNHINFNTVTTQHGGGLAADTVAADTVAVRGFDQSCSHPGTANHVRQPLVHSHIAVNDPAHPELTRWSLEDGSSCPTTDEDGHDRAEEELAV